MILPFLSLLITIPLLFLMFQSIPKKYSFFLIPVIFSHIQGIISSAYIESEIYIVEQAVDSYETGATARLAMYLIVFWIGAIVASKAKLKTYRIYKTSARINKIIISAVGFLLAVYLLNIALSWPPPLLSDGYITRYGYFENSALWPIISLFGPAAMIVPIALGFYWHTGGPEDKKAALFLMATYIVYMILAGNKYGGIIFPVFLFFIPSAAMRLEHNERIFGKTALALMLVGGFLVYSMLVFHYSDYALAKELGGPHSFILYRAFGLQAHLWWGIDHYIFTANGGTAPLSTITSSMDAMIRLVAPGSIADDAINRGVSFSFGFPASAIYYFGVLGGAIATWLMGFMLALSARSVFLALNSGGMFLYVLLGYLFLQILSVSLQGDFGVILSYKLIAILLLLVFSVFINERRA